MTLTLPSVISQMIQKFNLRPARLTNAVKCVSPGDRKPEESEVNACNLYLLAEIERFKPSLEFIVAVGGVSLWALLQKTGISGLSGGIVGKINGIKVFAMLHPAYVLRSPSEMERFKADFEALSKLYTGGSDLKAFRKFFPNSIAQRVENPDQEERMENAFALGLKAGARSAMLNILPETLEFVRKKKLKDTVKIK